MNPILTDAELKAMVTHDVAVIRDRAAAISGYATQQRPAGPVSVLRDDMTEGAR